MDLNCLAIRLLALVVIGAHLIAGTLPEEAAWGVWYYNLLPGPLGWLGGLAAASLILSPVNRWVDQWSRRSGLFLSRRVPNFLRKADRRFWFALVALGVAFPFWFFRIRHLRWGDAYFIVRALSYTGPDRPIWTIYNWQSPLTIFLHAQLWLLLNPFPGVGVETLYAITSVLSGIGFVYILFLLADCLGRDGTEKATVFGLVATTGSMQLFFGYVENYTLISLGILLTLYLSVRCLQDQASLAWPSLTLALSNAFHPSTTVLWPAMIYLAWRRAGRGAPSSKERLSEWVNLLLPPILVFLGLAALMTAGGHGPWALLSDDRPGGADGIPFVPLFEVTTEWQRYTMFSLAHLLDWANEHLLISPFGIPLLLLALWVYISKQLSTRGGEEKPDPPALFLVIASLAYLLLSFAWNPDYGGRKDWDLFAPSAFVYTLAGSYLTTRWWRESREDATARCRLAWIARLLIAVSALHTAAWIYFNTLPWPAV